jgi:hypothetical protein
MSAARPAQVPKNCALQHFVWIIAKTAWLHEMRRAFHFNNEFQLLAWM